MKLREKLRNRVVGNGLLQEQQNMFRAHLSTDRFVAAFSTASECTSLKPDIFNRPYTACIIETHTSFLGTGAKTPIPAPL